MPPRWRTIAEANGIDDPVRLRRGANAVDSREPGMSAVPQMVAGAEVQVSGRPARRRPGPAHQRDPRAPEPDAARLVPDPDRRRRAREHRHASVRGRRRGRDPVRAAGRRAVTRPDQGPGGLGRAGVRPRRRRAGGARLRPVARAQPHPGHPDLPEHDGRRHRPQGGRAQRAHRRARSTAPARPTTSSSRTTRPTGSSCAGSRPGSTSR